LGGAGSLAQKLLRTTALKSKIFKFVDSNQNVIGGKISGIEVISPELLHNYKFPILVLSYRYKKEIIKFIKKEGYPNSIITI